VPVGSVHEAHTPLSIEREVAVPLLTCQLKVAWSPGLIVLGEAVKVSAKGTVTLRL
jgi:hypothetical protein